MLEPSLSAIKPLVLKPLNNQSVIIIMFLFFFYHSSKRSLSLMLTETMEMLTNDRNNTIKSDWPNIIMNKLDIMFGK